MSSSRLYYTLPVPNDSKIVKWSRPVFCSPPQRGYVSSSRLYYNLPLPKDSKMDSSGVLLPTPQGVRDFFPPVLQLCITTFLSPRIVKGVLGFTPKRDGGARFAFPECIALVLIGFGVNKVLRTGKVWFVTARLKKTPSHCLRLLQTGRNWFTLNGF